jgi:adenylate cyclase
MPKALMVFHHNIYLTTLVGILMGLTHGILEQFVFNTKWKHINYSKLIAIRLLVYFTSLTIVTSTILFGYQVLFKDVQIQNALFALEDFILDGNYFMASIYGLFISMVLFFFNQINRKLGDGEFLNILTGKYHRPRIEHRIFMFLDLEDSTKIAEKLGHVQFSHLLQVLFAEIAKFVIKYDAIVYQHVGDEIVLSWKKDTSYDKILNLYYGYTNYLKVNRDRFLKQFGVIPIFKASINEGKVTVAQIGYTKQETAFHGEVLIVAARMQKLCKKYQADILISENCIYGLNESKIFRPKLLDLAVLKGKSKISKIYGIDRMENP